MKYRIQALLAAGLFLLGHAAQATTYTWYGYYIVDNPDYLYFDNNWSTPFNWFPEGVPGTGDTAIINTSAQPIYLNNDISVSNIVFGAGTNCANAPVFFGQNHAIHLYGELSLVGCGTFNLGTGGLAGATTNATVNGILVVNNGAPVTGPLIVASNSTLSISSGQLSGSMTVETNGTLILGSGLDQNWPSATLNNFGTVIWAAGRIRGGGLPGTVINNYGLFDNQADLTFNTDFGGDGMSFFNYGTFQKSGGTNSTTFATIPFYNYGNVDVQTGTVVVSAGGVLDGGTQTGAGTLLLNGGAFNINGTVTTTNLQLAGVSLTGQNAINGAALWLSGPWSGANVTITSNSVLYVASAADHDIGSCSLTNYGTLAWTGPGRVRGGGIPGTAMYNYGLWDAQGDWTFNDDLGGDGVIFYNYGTLRKSGGVNSTVFASGVYLSSVGTLDLHSGTLSLNSGGDFFAGVQNGPGTLLMAAGGFMLDGMTTTNATLNGGIFLGDVVVNGELNWMAGDWINANSLTIPSNSIVFVTSGADHNLGPATTNWGTVAWSAGRIRGGGVPGSAIWNYGLWDSQGDLTFNDDLGGDGTTFYNIGTFRKSAGTGNTTISPVNFQNTGLLDIETGNVVQGGGFFSGGIINIVSGSLSMSGGGVFTGGTQTGAGVLQLAGGNFSFNGLVASNLLMTGGVLFGTNQFSGTLNWAAGVWTSASSVTLASNTVFTVTTGADHDLASCTLNNYGTMTWSGGRIRGGGIPGTVINNYGLWDSQGDLTLNDDFGGMGTVINNYGTYRKSAGVGTTVFAAGVSLNNSGTVDFETGNLTLNGGFANSGAVNIVSGAVLLNGGGTLTGGVQTGGGLLQMAAGSFNDNGMTTTTNLEMSGGVLVGTNRFTSGITWAAGNWNSAPLVTIPTNAVLSVVSGADHDLASCTLNNFGTVTWIAGRIRGGGNPTTIFNNYGVWDSQADLTLNADYTLNGYVFNNFGTFLKSGGTGLTTFSAGTLGAGFRSSGVVNVATGAVLFNSGGTFTGGSIVGSGLALLASGGFSFTNTFTTTNVQEVGGTLGASAINGGFTWSSGVWNGGKVINILSNSLVNVVSGADHDMANCIVTNRGTVAWSGGRIRGGGNPGTLIYNYGVWDSQADLTLNSDYGINNVVFDNFGTFLKSGGTTGTIVNPGCIFNNTGTVSNETAAPLSLNGGGTFSGGSMMGSIILGAGSFNVNGALTSTNMQESGGLLVGSNILTGGFTWSSANWNSASSVTIASNAELDIASGADHDMANCVVNNNGKVEWLGGRIRGGGNPGTVVNNFGLWETQCDFALNTDYGVNGLLFNNTGKFHKFGTTGATTLVSGSGLGTTFTNTGGGRIQLDSGTLSLPASFTTPPAGMVFGLGGTNAGQWGRLAVAGNVFINGPMTVFLTNGFQAAVGMQFPLVTSVFDIGAFSTASLPPGFTLNYTNTAAYLVLTNPAPVQIISSVISGGNLLINFNTIQGQSYTIQTSTNLASSLWTPYQSFTGAGSLQQFAIPLTNTVPQVFVRISEP